jgi:hypothetical protein
MNHAALPYQVALRAVGASLDSLNATCYGILEISDGFVVQYSQELGSYPSTLEIVRSADLESLYKSDAQQRGTQSSAGGHQDFLRALGYVLDDAAAYSTLVEAIDDTVLVTYEYVFFAQEGGELIRKQHLVLDQEEKAALIRDARARRKVVPQKSGGMFRFRSRGGGR